MYAPTFPHRIGFECPNGSGFCSIRWAYLWAFSATTHMVRGHIHYRSHHPDAAGLWVCNECHYGIMYSELIAAAR